MALVVQEEPFICFLSVNAGFIKIDGSLETCVYRKKTNEGLLLHYQSHVDSRYKRSLLRTINSFDNDDMKSSKRHVVLVSLIFLLKCFSKSCFISFFLSFRLDKENTSRTRATFINTSKFVKTDRYASYFQPGALKCGKTCSLVFDI